MNRMTKADRERLIDDLYDMNVQADITIEDLADMIICKVENERTKTIDEFAQKIIDEIQIRQYDGEFCKEHHIEVSICTIIATTIIKEIADKLKDGVKDDG